MLALKAAKRLQAFETNNIKVNEFNPEDHSTRFNAKKVGTIHGYDVYKASTQYETFYTLQKGKETVAYLALDHSLKSKPNNIIYSVVAPAFVGKGLGFMLHEYLLAKYKVLSSDDSLSIGASKLWAKLIQKHQGMIVIPAFESYPLHKVAIQGWAADPKGYVWPTVNHNGEVVPVNTVKRTSAQRKALRYFFYEVRQ